MCENFDVAGQKRPDLSIVIVSFNRRQILLNCLSSIRNLDVTNEIYVVDNGSTDGSADHVARDFPNATLIRNGDNRGFARANNQALRICQSRYVLLLNDDTIVLPGTIEAMVRFMDANPAVGLAGCRLLNVDGSLQPSTYGSQSVFKASLRLTGLRRLMPKNAFWRETVSRLPFPLQEMFPGYWDHESLKEVSTIKGAFFLMRYEALQDVGLLDETTFMYHEEGDWAYRAASKGWKICFVPVTGVIHFGSANISTSNIPTAVIVEQHKGILNLFRKHHTHMEFWIVKWLMISISFFRYLFWIAGRLIVSEKANSQALAQLAIIRMALDF